MPEETDSGPMSLASSAATTIDSVCTTRLVRATSHFPVKCICGALCDDLDESQVVVASSKNANALMLPLRAKLANP
jgi:hypothetical protein